ncbi:MAG: sensor histidine kinase [Vulcanimicrobiaceae bacterium]
MAPATVSPRRSSHEPLVPRSLERRLFLSYFAVFTLLLLAFALAIHFSFVSSLKSQMEARLDALLSAGARSVHFTDGRFTVIENLSPTALLSRGQGLQWFDVKRNLIATEGLAPAQKHLSSNSETLFESRGSQLLHTRTLAIIDPKSGHTVGWVRAAQEIGQTQADAFRLDVILIVGGLCALVLAALGGRYLQRKSVEPIRTGYETLREFSADASHELRGPITAINSNADAAMRDEIGMRPRDRERFQAIADAAMQMKRLTEDLLLLARAGQSIERELFVVDLGTAIDKVVRLHRAAFETKGVTLTERVQSGVEVYGNPDQIERILRNLVENALHYTPADGAVEIEGRSDRGRVRVIVRDSGSGIAGEQIEKIFDRFWRAEPARRRSGGTGLGLAIARALARRHGGDVTASSRLGHGSEFVVTFPARPPT